MISCNGHIKYSTHKIIKRRDIFNNSFFAAILLVLRINDTLLNAYIEQSLSLLKYLDVNNHPDTCSTHWAAVMLYKKLASSTRLPRAPHTQLAAEQRNPSNPKHTPDSFHVSPIVRQFRIYSTIGKNKVQLILCKDPGVSFR